MKREIKFDLVYKHEDENFSHYRQTLEELMADNSKWGCYFQLNRTTHTDCELFAKREYTGFKDKNGAEIYEDDILNVIKLSYDNKNEFDPFICCVESFMGNWHLDVNKMLFICYGEEVEIIGNKYENPELLKEIEKCDKKDIEGVIQKSLNNPELDKSSDRLQMFLDKLKKIK